MARLEEIPEPTRTAVATIPCPAFDTTPFVAGPPLSKRRVAIVSSAALIERGDKPFPFGSGECRPLKRDANPDDVLISHVSINFDRAGYQRDINVVYPIDRLNHMAIDGLIGSVADTHFTVMGSTDPAQMVEAADDIANLCTLDRVDAVVLLPV